MQHRLTMMNERIYHFAGGDIPNTYCRIAGPTNDDLIIVLQTQHRARMAGQCFHAFQIAAIPDLDRIIAQAGHNFLVVVLQTIHTLRILRSAIDALQHMLTGAPIVLYALDVVHNFRKERPIE